MKKRLLLLLFVAACAPMAVAPPPMTPAPPAPQPAPAPAPPPTPTPAPPSGGTEQMTFDAWKASFLSRHGGANRGAFERELAGLTPDMSVVRSDGNQPEFSRPVGAYVQAAASADKVRMGKQRLDRVPWEVEQRLGVPKEILVAIWAQESAFGAIQGDKDVIRSLATLAWEGRRRDWAEGQLANALRIVIEGRRDRSGLLGSWAGAMGQTQFMPDNYLNLAIDGDGDGRVDIWGSDADALASAANLLNKAGWKRGQGWAYEVVLPQGFDYGLADSAERPWSDWSRQGVTLARGGSLNAAEAAEQATILLPQGADGPAFLALPNHYMIRRYNNSVAYALAIGLIADGLADKPGLVASWPSDGGLSRDQRFGAQRALQALGYDPGGVDGVIGAGTRRALKAWQQANGVRADGYLSSYLADTLIAAADR